MRFCGFAAMPQAMSLASPFQWTAASSCAEGDLAGEYCLIPNRLYRQHSREPSPLSAQAARRFGKLGPNKLKCGLQFSGWPSEGKRLSVRAAKGAGVWRKPSTEEMHVSGAGFSEEGQAK